MNNNQINTSLIDSETVQITKNEDDSNTNTVINIT